MVRSEKPYQRPDNYHKSNPDAPGRWNHDLHPSSSPSLSSRLGGHTSTSTSTSTSKKRPTLADRISGSQGKELLPSTSKIQLHGFGSSVPVNPTNPNAGMELLPPSGSGRLGNGNGSGNGPLREALSHGVGQRSLVKSGLDAALGLKGVPRRAVRQVVQNGNGAGYASGSGSGNGNGLMSPPPTGSGLGSVSIMGAARGTVFVRVENLAVGTTADDVVSAFAPLPILSSKITSPPQNQTVTVDLEFQSRTDADQVVAQYNGAMADGNVLKVGVLVRGLAERMGGAGAVGFGGGGGSGGGGGVSGGGLERISARETTREREKGREDRGGEELLPQGGNSKLYSDAILASNPRTAILTLADTTPSSGPASRTSNARGYAGREILGGGSSLASRLGRGSR